LGPAVVVALTIAGGGFCDADPYLWLIVAAITLIVTPRVFPF
jgi:hypothetical protein